MKTPHSIFILSTLIAHGLMMGAGVFFFGAEYTILLAFFWMLAWVHYCNILREKDEETYNNASYLKLVLIGGIFCWIICPWAFIPSKHRSHKEPFPWFTLLRLYELFSSSVVKVVHIIFSLAHEVQEGLAAKDAENRQDNVHD